MEHAPAKLPIGWAIRTRKRVQRFNDNQKSFMIEKFHQGITSGTKLTPEEVAAEMQMSPQFTAQELLEPKQI